MIKVKVKKLENFKGILPKYAKEGDAGMDVRSLELKKLHPGHRHTFMIGLAFEIPKRYEIQVRPRSGLAAKYGITVVNSPGTIDQNYRGEVGIILLNTGKDPIVISEGDRIAQLVLKESPQMELVEVDELTETDRGEGGFGSTGGK